MLKITLAELKKSLYAIKNNNELQCIAGEQLVNINDNITFPLVNLYDILNGTLNMLNILKNRGFIDVKTIFENPITFIKNFYHLFKARKFNSSFLCI